MKYLVVLCAASLIAAPVQVALAAPARAVAEVATIRPGETLDIQIAGDTALSKNYTVDAAGQITLDLIGAVTVAGRTPAQVAADLQTRLSRFLKLRSVTVRPVAAATQDVTVTGAVVTPGVVRLRPGSSSPGTPRKAPNAAFESSTAADSSSTAIPISECSKMAPSRPRGRDAVRSDWRRAAASFSRVAGSVNAAITASSSGWWNPSSASSNCLPSIASVE